MLNEMDIEGLAEDYKKAMDDLVTEEYLLASIQTKITRQITFATALAYAEENVDGKNAPERKAQEEYFVNENVNVIQARLHVAEQTEKCAKAKVSVEYHRMLCSLHRALLYSQSGKEV